MAAIKADPWHPRDVIYGDSWYRSVAVNMIRNGHWPLPEAKADPLEILREQAGIVLLGLDDEPVQLRPGYTIGDEIGELKRSIAGSHKKLFG